MKWILDLSNKNDQVRIKLAEALIDKHISNLSSPIWRQAIRIVGYEPPYKTVKLYAKAQWEQIYANHIQNADSEHQVQVKTGVTNSQSETKSFSTHIGMSTTASAGVEGLASVSTTLSFDFTQQSSYTHGISLTKEQTVTETFSFKANTYVQVWQLLMTIEDEAGNAITQRVPNYQTLTYPPSPAPAPAEIKAMLKEHMTALGLPVSGEAELDAAIEKAIAESEK